MLPQLSIRESAANDSSFGLFPRLLALTILFAIELLLISVWLDDAALISRGGFLGFAGQWGAWTVRGIVGYAAIFFTFAYLKSRAALNQISNLVKSFPVNPRLLAAHAVAMAIFGSASWALYGNHVEGFSATPVTVIWLLAGICGIVLGAFAFMPRVLWARLLRDTGWLWAYTLLAVIFACIAGGYSRVLWLPSSRLTYALVKSLLSLFVTGIIANPMTMHLGTTKFAVEIAPECSGYEGAGLILAFGVVWLWFFRDECRFPRALILIPAGVVLMYLLNAVRITSLILIGDAGATRIALGGFHSQAGWIAFNAVALGFSLAARRLPWLTTTGQTTAGHMGTTIAEPSEESADNPAATYLLPFLSILAVGMVTGAVSGDFQWLYPLRFLAAAGALWFLRKRYATVDWSFSWFGPAMGVLAFVIWLGMDALLNTPTHDVMPGALAATTPAIRTTWIVFRILAAVITVPIAEELAFRGFLIRRFLSGDIEALPPQSFTWFGLGVTSIAFGILHGNLWFAGILAGLLYAWALLRRGKLGEAIVAHATTNALLAAYVLLFHKWHLW
ncbi:MAG TPA: exosortase E/protease, VPEID-CTERM system [Bryobacteraceae bacterium]|nr:exosortase E/protease, VPEID-CTERM system [Bryobacteraceae bacterium]